MVGSGLCWLGAHRFRSNPAARRKDKMKITNDERINGALIVSLYAHPTDANPDCNDPSTHRTATVVGLAAAREWIDANGGYSDLKASFAGPFISGWSVMRFFRNAGYRSVGSVQPANGG